MGPAESRTAAYRAVVSAGNLRVVSADCHEWADIGPRSSVIDRDFDYSTVITGLNVETVTEIQGRFRCD